MCEPKLRDGSSKVRPGSPALVRSMRPAPISSTLAGTVCAVSSQTSVTEVVINADLIWVGVQLGCICLSSAAAPATCGAAMLVPLACPKPMCCARPVPSP